MALQVSSNKSITKESGFRISSRPGPDSHEWLQSVDVAKESLKRKFVDDWNPVPTLTLGPPKIKQIKPSLLGPILKRRFLDENSSACVSVKQSRRRIA